MAINIPIITDFDGKGLDRAVREFKKLETAGEKAAFLLKKAMLPAVAAVGALGVALTDATKAAIEDQAAQRQLALTLRNVTGATNQQLAAVEKQISALSKASGVADDELRPAFEALTRGTKDIAESTRQMTLVMDIARGTQRPLVDVADALAKAYQGNFRGLQQLTPEMKTLIKDGADMNTILSVLGGTFGGLSKDFASTAQGSLARLNVAFNEAKESIGSALIPVIEQLLPKLIAAASWFEDNTSLVLKFAAGVGVFAGAIIGANAALSAYRAMSAIVTAWNAIMATSFRTLTLSVGTATAALGVVTLWIATFKSVRDEGYGALNDLGKAFSNFGKLAANVVIGVDATVRNTVRVVVNGILQMVNAAITGLNYLNPLQDIPTFNLYDYVTPKYLSMDFNYSTGFGQSGSAFPNLATDFRGSMPGSLPSANMMIPAVTVPETTGGGRSGGGGGGRAGAIAAPTAIPTAATPGAGYVPPFQSFTAESFMAAHEAMFGVNEITVNVTGGLATSAEIGEAVVNSLRQYTQINGPLDVAIA